MLLLLHSTIIFSVVKLLLKGEVGVWALNSHGNYIVDHGKSWKNHGIVFLNFCGNPDSCVDALHLSQHFFILVRYPVFLDWTSSNTRIKCLVQGHTCNALLPVSLEQTTLPYIKSNTLFLYKNKDFFAFKLSNVLFEMLILVKMPTVFAILTFMSSWNFILNWVEHKNTFITLMPGVPSLSAYP